MEFLKPRTLKARQQILTLLAPCLAPVQDDLGNVPIEMQQDPYVNGTLLGLCERVCESFQIKQATRIKQVTAAVFEDIYRREATTVLLACDRQLLDPDSDLSGATRAVQGLPSDNPDRQWVQPLCDYVRAHFKRPNFRVL